MDGGGREHRTLGQGGLPALERAIRLVPRPVRRAGRLATRHVRGVLDGRITPPRSATAWLNASVLGGAALIATIHSGHTAEWTDASLAAAGFAIVDVRLDGARETNDADIAASIGLGTTVSLPAIDVEAARSALLGLPWIAGVEIEKMYPGTLSVVLREREAVALWRVGERTLLLDADGAPIVADDGRELPLLAGEGADAAMQSGLEVFAAVPAVTNQIKALVRVGGRRWDLVTHRNVTVHLPEDRPEVALERLVALQGSHALLDKDVVSIDMRIGDRIALRLPEEGAKARRDRVDAQAKERRKTKALREVAL